MKGGGDGPLRRRRPADPSLLALVLGCLLLVAGGALIAQEVLSALHMGMSREAVVPLALGLARVGLAAVLHGLARRGR